MALGPTERRAKSTAEELPEQLFRRHLFLEASAPLPCKPAERRSSCTGPCRRRVEARIRITSKLVKLALLVRVAEDLESLADKLECIVCARIAVLVRMCEQRQLPVCFLDLAVRARLFHFFQPKNFVIGSRCASLDTEDCGLLLDGVGAASRAVVVRAFGHICGAMLWRGLGGGEAVKMAAGLRGGAPGRRPCGGFIGAGAMRAKQ